MKEKIYTKIAVLSILFSAVFFIHSVFAQTTPTLNNAGVSNITYPIKELGNCKNQGNCRAYCNDPANMAVCAQFAYQHGMIDEGDLNNAKQYGTMLQNGGPGGCTTQASCISYCNDTSHLTECLTFAKDHKLIEVKDLEKAQKVLQALNSGEATPGECKTQQECENYCKDPAHMTECFSFAQKSGLMSEDDIKEANKVIPFIQSGETPGKCTTKDQCEEYCSSQDHFDECISFAEKAGLVTPEEAQNARKAGGVGPGGCRSQDACENYCNQDANAAECLSFAKEKGILSEDKIKEIEDGMGRLRSGLDQMPEEMVTCLKSSIGEDVLGKIKDGTFVPGPGIGSKIQSCVDEYAPKLKATLDKAFSMATPEVMICLSDSLGQTRLDAIKGGDNPTPKEGDQIKNCFEKMREEGMQKAMEGLSKMPPETIACLQQKLGADTIAKIKAGDKEALGPESEDAFKSCLGDFQEKMKSQIENNFGEIPDSAKECVKQKLGDDFEEKLSNGQMDPAQVQNQISVCMKDVIMNKKGGNKGEGFGGGDFKTNMPILPGMPKEIPEGGMMGGPGGVQGQTPPGGQNVCASFASVPSCSYLPDNLKDQCEKCKGN